jgi:hypothetical protein
MTLKSDRNRVLNPIERFSEIVFGLIMVLSFTCAISVAEIGREDVRATLVGAIGCNLAWGIIDAAFYLIAALTERGHNASLLRRVQMSGDPSDARLAIDEVLPPIMAEALQPGDYDRIRAHLRQKPVPPEKPRFTAEDWKGALGVFLLVFLSTFPVVIPFIFIHEAHLAMRISNGIAIVMLFAAGNMLARHANLSRIRTGLSMVAIGVALVAVTIALGG